MSDDLAEYAHLWDGTDTGWVVERVEHSAFTLEVQVPVRSAAVLQKLRRLLPELGTTSPVEAREALQDGLFRIEGLGAYEHRQLRRELEQAGFDVHSSSTFLGGFVPVKDGVQLRIEDADTAREVARRMLAAGVPLVDVHVD